MSTDPRVELSSSAHGRLEYAMLRVDGRSVVVPHRRIHSVEPVLDMRFEPRVAGSVGDIAVGGRIWVVYCLDADLGPVTMAPEARRLCVLFADEPAGLGLLCDELRPLTADRVRIVPLPGCMRDTHSAVEALVVVDDLVCPLLCVARLLASVQGSAASGDAPGHDEPGPSVRSETSTH